MKTGVVGSQQHKVPKLIGVGRIEGDYYAKRIEFSKRLREFNAATRDLPRRGRAAAEWTRLAAAFACACIADFGMPQRELAKSMGVHWTTVNGWLMGRRVGLVSK